MVVCVFVGIVVIWGWCWGRKEIGGFEEIIGKTTSSNDTRGDGSRNTIYVYDVHSTRNKESLIHCGKGSLDSDSTAFFSLVFLKCNLQFDNYDHSLLY